MSREDTERHVAQLVEKLRAERAQLAAVMEEAKEKGTDLSEFEARLVLARIAGRDRAEAQARRLDELDALVDPPADGLRGADQPEDYWWTPNRRKAYEAYPEAVRWCRVNLARGATYSSVSKRLGIHRHTLKKWVDERRFPKLEDVER